MTRVYASIVIPVYNQYESLCVVIRAFNYQTFPKDYFEIVIVNDGSTDETCGIDADDIYTQYGLQTIVLHQKNMGRAAARNAGVKLARGGKIIFCDADRFPAPQFVAQHMCFQDENKAIVVGASYDYFGKCIKLATSEFDWDTILRFSRTPSYFKKIMSIYDTITTTSSLAWLSFLVGNASVCKSIFYEVGGFNESFKEWGFEHFDLALRMHRAEHKFYLNKEACNYHLPHARPPKFYENMIIKNTELFTSLHPNVSSETFQNVLLTNMTIEEAEEGML